MSTYYARFAIFNLSEHACSIRGYPKLFALGATGASSKVRPTMGREPPKRPKE